MGDKSCYMGAGGYSAPSATVTAGSGYAREEYAYNRNGDTNNYAPKPVSNKMVQKVNFEYKDDAGTVFEGVLCKPTSIPEGRKLPGVLVHHTFAGCGDFEVSRAERLAELGYIALAADVYGKGVRGTSFKGNFALVKPFIAARTTLLKNRLLASLNALKSVTEVDGNRVAALGFCFGGLCSLDLARHNVGLLAAISYHGTLTPLPEAAYDHFETTVQIHHGDADSHIKQETIDGIYAEMRERKVDFSFAYYGKAMHGFTEPHADSFGFPGVGYNKEADVRSWAATEALLKEKFQA